MYLLYTRLTFSLSILNLHDLLEWAHPGNGQSAPKDYCSQTLVVFWCSGYFLFLSSFWWEISSRYQHSLLIEPHYIKYSRCWQILFSSILVLWLVRGFFFWAMYACSKRASGMSCPPSRITRTISSCSFTDGFLFCNSSISLSCVQFIYWCLWYYLCLKNMKNIYFNYSRRLDLIFDWYCLNR